MKSIENFKEKKIDLKLMKLKSGGTKTGCCEIEMNTTQWLSPNFPADKSGGYDHTIEYYDDDSNLLNVSIERDFSSCPIF